jgi:hypothetical protein
MHAKFATAILFLLAATAFAQSEFGRASGGDVDLITKHGQPFSGSLEAMMGTGSRYGATFGGTAVPDRIWFFASIDKSQAPLAWRSIDQAVSRATSANMNTQIGDRQNLAAVFSSLKQPGLTTSSSFTTETPTSFRSLHYTGILSNNMFITGSFSQFRGVTAPSP